MINVFKFSNLDVFESTSLNFKYTVNTSDTGWPKIYYTKWWCWHNNTYNAEIQESSTDTTTNTYTLLTIITALDNTSKVYFLQEVEKINQIWSLL